MYVLCHVAWGSAWNLFIYRSIGWTTVHHIYGLSLCMSEWVYLWAMCLFLLSFVTMSAHKFSAKYSAIEWKTTLYEPFMQADITHALTNERTIDCCHFTLEAYVYERIIIYIDWWEWRFSMYTDFLIGIDTFILFSCNKQTNKWKIDPWHPYIVHSISMAQILFILRTNNHFADEIHYIWLDLSVSDIFLFPANLYILLYQFFISISKRKDFDFNVLGVHHEINNVCVCSTSIRTQWMCQQPLLYNIEHWKMAKQGT